MLEGTQGGEGTVTSELVLSGSWWGSGKSETIRQEDPLGLGTKLDWYGHHQASKCGTAPTVSAFPGWLLPLSCTFPQG